MTDGSIFAAAVHTGSFFTVPVHRAGGGLDLSRAAAGPEHEGPVPGWRALGGLTVLALVIAGPASAWSWGAARVADCGESAHAIEVLDDTLPAEARCSPTG